jgi:hypothetical protein
LDAEERTTKYQGIHLQRLLEKNSRRVRRGVRVPRSTAAPYPLWAAQFTTEQVETKLLTFGLSATIDPVELSLL